MAYQPTVWAENDLISINRMNKLEKGLEQVSKVQEENNPLYNSFGPSNEVNINFKSEGISVYPVSEIRFIQEGSGAPSPENVRNITGWDSISLLHNGSAHTQSLPETVYGGSYDWAKGELKITHKVVALAVANMNYNEDFPGWTNCTWLNEIFDTRFNKTVSYPVNVGDRIGVTFSGPDSDSKWWVVFMPAATYGMKQSEWKAQYPDLVVQMILPLLEPRTIQLAPQEFLSIRGTNVFSSDCGNTSVYIESILKKYMDDNVVHVTRTINGKALDADINLTASNVGARSSSWIPTAAQVGAIPSTAVANITLLTQAEYDALAAKEVNTLYLIKEGA